jgi:SulP family sulfate permease
LQNVKNLFNKYSGDMLSGLTTATIALPQNMAYALILGINPIYGIYASIFSMLTASIFNFSSYVIVGPTNMLTVALYSSLSSFQGENYLQVIFLTTFLIGLFQFLLVSFNLSELIKYISHPVVVGLSHGAAVLILFSQIENFTGVSVSGSNVITKSTQFISNISELNYLNLAVGAATLFLIFVIPLIKKSLPEYLITVVLMTILTTAAGINQSIPLVGEIPKRIIDFNLISLDWNLIGQVYTKAFSIALLGLIQTMAVLQSLALKTEEEPNFDREFRSQGITNMVISFFSGFAISSSFAKTFTNLSAGAKHRVSQFFSAISIILFIIFFRTYLAYIPVAVLAGLVISAAVGILDLKEVIRNLKTTRGDALIFGTTFLATIVLPNIDQAIYFGVLVSLVVVLQISKEADIDMLYYDKKEDDEGYHLHNIQDEKTAESDISARQARVIDLKGAVHFSAADDLKEQLEEFYQPKTDFIIRLRNVRRIDITIIKVLEDFIDQVQENGGEIMLTGVNERLLKIFRKIGLVEKVGEANIYLPETEYFAATHKALEFSHNGFGKQKNSKDENNDQSTNENQENKENEKNNN